MSLCGEYFIDCQYGTLIVSATSRGVDYRLRNGKGIFTLCSEKNIREKQLRLPFDDHLALDSLEKFLLQNGERITQAVSQFRNGRSKIYQFCINGAQPAVELIDDSPALAYLIAYKLLPDIAREILPESIQCILSKKRSVILAQINWPHSKGIVKLLRKIPASQCRLDMLQNLHSLLISKNPVKIKVLRHLPVLHQFLVKLLADEELSQYFTPTFYEAMSQISPDADPPPGLEVFVLKKQLIEAISTGFPLSPLRSLAELKALHERFISWLMNKDHYENVKHLIFPFPPFPKTVIKNESAEEFGIFPLANVEDLWREGAQMNHCIAGYIEEIAEAKGLMYAYHVKLPNELPATVMIAAVNNAWQVNELRGAHNQAVSSYVDHWVDCWIKKQNLSELIIW